MRTGQLVDHPPLHSVPTLLSEVKVIRTRLALLIQEVEQFPAYFERTTPQEDIDATLHIATNLQHRVDRDIARFEIVKQQLRQRGYTWEWPLKE